MVERSSQPCPGKEYNKSCSFASRLIVMIASAIVVVMFLSLAPDNLLNKRCGDCETYYVPIAKNLLAGQGLVTSNGRPALERPPGHALILAAVIGIGRVFRLEQQKAVYIFNTLAISLSTVLLFSIARRYWGLMSSLIVAGLWGLSPFLLWFSNQPYSEIPFFLTLFAAVYSFLSATERTQPSLAMLILSASLLGVSMLIRPIAYGLVVVFIIVYWVSNYRHSLVHRFIVIGTVILCIIAIVGSWIGFTHKKNTSFLRESSSMITRLSLIEGLTFGVRQKDYRQGIDLTPEIKLFMEDMDEIFSNYDNLPNGKVLYGPGGEYDIQKPWNIVRIASNHLYQTPTTAIKIVLFKARRSWYGTDSNRDENISAPLQIFYLSLIIPALVAGLFSKKMRPFVFLVAGITAYFWFMAVLFTPLVRFMIPALGLLFTLVPGIWVTLGPSVYRKFRR